LRVLHFAYIFIFCLGFNSLNGQINADFSSPNIEACGSLQTTFFDQSTSTNEIVSWSWDLGGNTSTKQDPGAIFALPGKYTICLTVTDDTGASDTECKDDYIIILPNPVVEFVSDVNEGCAPITVNFTDQSTSENGPIISWLWDIGGSTGVVNTTDSEENIFTSYSFGGNYTASLTIEDDMGCKETKSIANFINVFQIAEPDIQADFLSSCQLPWEVRFENANADPSVSYLWDFGNGTTYEGISPPTVNYTEAGEYDISIFMSSGDCRDTITLENYINTDESAGFTWAPLPTCENKAIRFTDQSVVLAESVLWNFGDGQTSTKRNPIHTFENAGCYDVTLIRNAGACSDTVVVSCVDIMPTPEVQITIENQFDCLLPTTIMLQGSSPSEGSYEWEILNAENKITADSNNVPITIEKFGSYFVNVTFTGESGCIYQEDSIPVTISPFEVILPEIGPSGCAPLSFALSDDISSQENIINWEWTVGNPVLFTSTDENPSFTISDTGRYDVQLIVENVNGCIDTISIEDYIRVGMRPDVDFVATPLESCIEEDKFFTDLSSDFADEWIWLFGEDESSTEQNPIVSFGTPGLYDITLIASHNGCANSLTISEYITLLEPYSRFTIDYNCEDPIQYLVIILFQIEETIPCHTMPRIMKRVVKIHLLIL